MFRGSGRFGEPEEADGRLGGLVRLSFRWFVGVRLIGMRVS